MNALILSTCLLFLDWGQTLEISKSDQYVESNIILGEAPSRQNINLYFISAIVVNAAIGYTLPKSKRKIFWYGVAFTQGVYVTGNFTLGVGVSF